MRGPRTRCGGGIGRALTARAWFVVVLLLPAVWALGAELRGRVAGGPVGGGVGSFPGPDEFYVRLVVRADGLEDPGNILGRLEGAADGFDGFDLAEIPPIGPPYLTIVFPHPEWGGSAGDYTVDYREARPGAGGAWSFEVRSDVARSVTITWEVVQPAGADVLARSTLEDLGVGGSVQPEPGGSYTVAMVGTVHAFAWVMNARPLVEAGPDQAGPIGELVSLPPATFTDEDTGDTHTATVDWGDGEVEPATVDEVAGTIAANHVYQALGQLTVEVCASDNHGLTGCDAFLASVGCAAGNVDGLGLVDGDDVVALVGHLLGTPAPCPDVNGDGQVDAADLAAEAILIWEWQLPPPPRRAMPAPPPPASAGRPR
jgi:hypothetical protein